MNHGLYTDTAWRVPVLFRDPGGTVFRFRSTGAAVNYFRANSLLDLMGLTPAEIDALFIAAAAR